ncbi:MAG TPA: DUF58 domain-containing protein [Actinopolymorphaceae bacterium]|jgi:uncharacterized protein (DUF58 family)
MSVASAVRGAFAGLTPRGRAFAWSGVAVALLALILGQRDLLRVAILLTALPLVAAMILSRSRLHLQTQRQLGSHRITAGGRADVSLMIRNDGRLPTGVLLGEDHLPAQLGSSPRFVLERMSARWHHKLSYRAYCDLRGRYPIGPLTIRVTDPFGLVEQTSRFADVDWLLVVPRVIALPYLPVPGEQASTGESAARSVTAVGDQDLTVREYRRGDDLRRVHWRSTARRGELMVRREEQPWRARATIMLDTRDSAHAGRGLGSSFEWAVSVAASVGVHLTARGYQVTVIDESGALVADVAGVRRGYAAEMPEVAESGAELGLLDALAAIRTARHRGLAERDLAGDTDSIGLLIVVAGALEKSDTDGLIRLERQATSTMAILLDVPAWRHGPGVAAPAVGTPPNPGTTEAARRLQLAGFRTCVAGPNDALPLLWRDLVLTGRSLRDADSSLPREAS